MSIVERLAVAITGVAGPQPDEDGNPISLVYCGVARADDSKVTELRFAASGPDAITEEAAWKRTSPSVSCAAPDPLPVRYSRFRDRGPLLGGAE